MARMVLSPVIVRREGHNADHTTNPIVRKAAIKERPVAAIMLDHEQPYEETRRGNGQQQAGPPAMRDRYPRQGPKRQERDDRDAELEDAAATIGLAVGGEKSQPGRIAPISRRCLPRFGWRGDPLVTGRGGGRVVHCHRTCLDRN